MRIAYFDCFSGAGGDMIVASLLHAGADAAVLQERIGGLGVGGYRLSIDRVKKQGFAATRFGVHLEEPDRQPHRHLKHIVEIIEKARLSERVRRDSIRVFERLAEAEARVHGTTIEKVHFHEVGAVDALVDVVGAMIALELLGIDQVRCSAIPVGSGTITCSHGIMPVPAPATAELLAGVPLAACDEPGELTTPTAAAVLTTLAQSFGPLPAMTVRTIGYGAGTREGVSRPNVLRVFIGDLVDSVDGASADEITVLETNLDDASPQVLGYCMERLLQAGALDAFAVPIQMKKSRPGTLLSVLCEPHRAEELECLLFAETTTFGVRRHNVRRAKMIRRHETVATAYGSIRFKVGQRDGIATATPEFEDCRTAAERHAVALREVMAAAQAEWARKCRMV